MSKPTESEILGALATYRNHINNANRWAMEQILALIIEAEVDYDYHESEEEAEVMKLEYLERLLGVTLSGICDSPRDLLAKWNEVKHKAALDGATVNPDTEWRNKTREEYKAGILDGLNALECPTGQWEFPHDLEIVMQHVDSLEGGGIYWFRDMGGFIFWEGWGSFESRYTRLDYKEKVISAEKIEEWMGLEDYQVAGGFRMGHGSKSFSHAFYGRPKNDENGAWSWRYSAVAYASDSGIFENIGDALDWYKKFGVLKETDISESTSAFEDYGFYN